MRNPKRVPYKSKCGTYLVVPLACGLTAKADIEDFNIISKYNWRMSDNFYIKGWLSKYKCEYMHRVLMNPDGTLNQVDHINGDRLDNRRSNLRLCDGTLNMANSFKRKKSLFKGIYLYKRGKTSAWVMNIWYRRIKLSSGLYYTPEEAAIAYDFFALMLFGEFARTNFNYI